MSGIRPIRASGFSLISLLVVTLAGIARGELVTDNSGWIFFSASNTASFIIDSLEGAGVRLQQVVPSGPSAIESPSTIEFAPVEVPAWAPPLTVVGGPGQEWLAAMGDEPDPPGEGEEFAAVPQLSTWCAGLLTLSALLWPLSRRSWMRRKVPLHL